MKGIISSGWAINLFKKHVIKIKFLYILDPCHDYRKLTIISRTTRSEKENKRKEKRTKKERKKEHNNYNQMST